MTTDNPHTQPAPDESPTLPMLERHELTVVQPPRVSAIVELCQDIQKAIEKRREEQKAIVQLPGYPAR